MPPLKAQLLLEESLSAYFPEMVFTDSGITVQLHRNTHMVTFTDGSVYFQPKLAKPSTGFTVRKNDEVNFDVQLNGELLTHHDSYAGVDVAHQFAIQGGQVALIELFSGGVGCPVLYQLVVARQDSPTMISTEFGTCSDQGKLSTESNGFTLNLPGNPSERWVWDASSFTLRKQS
ncbi:hypothetical protein [Aeromonas rivipollensis]|uniref:hypothetical protein n=1 Tax=Aeromonas rivipollensis TaxID=948519 RepID=UPI003D242675